MRINSQRMIDVLGTAPKPKSVWEQQFDGFNAELAEMAQMDWDKVPEEYLWYYFHDLTYVELQPDLFRHLFPACLKYWYETLMQDRSAERGDADFHNAIMRGDFVGKLLSEPERTRLYDFFRDGFLDRIDAQKDFKHSGAVGSSVRSSQNSWIYRFNTLGIVAPVIQPIWEAWWTLDNPGKAYCAVMYASGLIYFNGENPVYDAWTRAEGGGGPYLTETEGSIFDWAWRSDNLNTLKGLLSVDYILSKLAQAQAVLDGPEDADIIHKIINDAQSRKDIIESKIGDLISNLAKLDLEKDHWE